MTHEMAIKVGDIINKYITEIKPDYIGRFIDESLFKWIENKLWNKLVYELETPVSKLKEEFSLFIYNKESALLIDVNLLNELEG